MKNKIIKYFQDVVGEMKKVTWPKKQELKDFTMVTIITMIVFAAFVWLIDQGISIILKAIIVR
ncbi:MAG TPA: preprotein translocase subunit SecE [Ignavibacteria bacterium]